MGILTYHTKSSDVDGKNRESWWFVAFSSGWMPLLRFGDRYPVSGAGPDLSCDRSLGGPWSVFSACVAPWEGEATAEPDSGELPARGHCSVTPRRAVSVS